MLEIRWRLRTKAAETLSNYWHKLCCRTPTLYTPSAYLQQRKWIWGARQVKYPPGVLLFLNTSHHNVNKSLHCFKWSLRKKNHYCILNRIKIPNSFSVPSIGSISARISLGAHHTLPHWFCGISGVQMVLLWRWLSQHLDHSWFWCMGLDDVDSGQCLCLPKIVIMYSKQFNILISIKYIENYAARKRAVSLLICYEKWVKPS